jgi:protein-S-isoprenylcysteine O-methyltransferase Ste14
MSSSHVLIERRRASRVMQFLYVPWVDRAIAVIAVLPSTVELYHRYFGGNLSFPRAVLGIQILLLIVTMVFRRTPVRVTPNPWFWLLAFVATYGLFAFTAFAPNGRPLVPSFVTNSLAVVSVAVQVFARLSLGRSIGFVPANRGIVTTGAYRFVRHPIYLGMFVALMSFVLRSYSRLSLALAVLLVLLFMVKSIVEERFLTADPEYAAYLRQVRWRWFPGVA